VNDEQTITTLQRAADTATRDHHLAPGAATAAWEAAWPATQRRSRGRLVAAVAASVAVTAGGAAAVATWVHHDDRPPAGGGGSACSLTTEPLPTWARGGFSADSYRTAHVMGKEGRIVAIPFIRLRVHQPPDAGNKVLWVSKAGYGPLRIVATLEGTSRTVVRTLPDGPGPSYVDMPAPGCWRMNLSWAGRHDTLGLRYYP